MVTILGALLGFIGSLFPELFKLLHDRSDRKHELILMDKQIEFQKLASDQRLEEIRTQGDIIEIAALQKNYKIGVEWVDALNGTVRPVIAYCFFFLYSAMKIVAFASLDAHAPLSLLYDTVWADDDRAIFAGIISFYFGSRAMQKIR